MLMAGYMVQDDPDDMESSILLRLTQVDLKKGFSPSESAQKFATTVPVWRAALMKEGEKPRRR